MTERARDMLDDFVDEKFKEIGNEMEAEIGLVIEATAKRHGIHPYTARQFWQNGRDYEQNAIKEQLRSKGVNKARKSFMDIFTRKDAE